LVKPIPPRIAIHTSECFGRQTGITSFSALGAEVSALLRTCGEDGEHGVFKENEWSSLFEKLSLLIAEKQLMTLNLVVKTDRSSPVG
jgi:hypothetical protein